MSTTNSNLDNDPFPVFTPRSALQQQLGRSPASQSTSSSSNNAATVNSNGAANLNMLMQQSPYGSRFNAANQGQNMLNMIRSPSNSLAPGANSMRQQQQQQQLLNEPNRQMISMVQNLSLNQNNSITQQSPLSTKLQNSTNSAPLPQLSQSSHLVGSSASHRKLFPNIDNNHHLNSNDMSMLNGGGGGDPSMHHHLGGGNSSVPGSGLGPHHMLQPPQLDEQHLNRGPPADLSSIVHLKRSDSYFIGDELKTEMLRKNLVGQNIPTQDYANQVPNQVKDYHNLIPLDNQQINIEHKSRTFAYQTISYKATHIKTNCLYYLKRIINFRYVNQRCIEVVEAWKKIQNANIITLRDVFGTKEFNGEHSIVFVYDYYPGLDTLQYRLYNNPNINLKGWSNPYNLDGAARPYSAGKTINGSRSLGLLPEQSVWEYVIQLTSIIRAVHSANLSCRIITASRLLVDHKSRLRLSGVGIFDVVDYENSLSNVAQYQQEDLIEFGRLVLALACNSLIAIQKEHINTSVEIISRNYSSDLRNLILHFMTPPANMNGRVKSINDSMPIIGARFYTSLDNAYTRGDIIENELSKELENGRLFRLIAKMNIVLERDGDWSETGDRYMLKLFRDYVFHQVTPNGQPWIDMAHMVQCLNKFDMGSNEKICLVSPDSQNIMIVSYAQLKKCFEKVFNEITSIMNN